MCVICCLPVRRCLCKHGTATCKLAGLLDAPFLQPAPLYVPAELPAVLPVHIPRHPGSNPLLEPQLCALHVPGRAHLHCRLFLQRHHHPSNAVCRHRPRAAVVVPVPDSTHPGGAPFLVAVLQIRVQLCADGRCHLQLHADIHPHHAAHGLVCVDDPGLAEPGRLLSR